jgi:hypothetical protein
MKLQTTQKHKKNNIMADGDITLSVPRATFDQFRSFMKAFTQIMDAADSKIKADEKMAGAHGEMGDLMNPPQTPGLEDFGNELNAASNRGLGMGPMQ